MGAVAQDWSAMTNPQSELDHKIDDLLIRWHEWNASYVPSTGFASRDATSRDAVSAWSPYDRDNGVSEAHFEREVMRAVSRAIDRIPNVPHMYRTAIQIEARNLAVGVDVWWSGRLPKNAEEAEVLRLEARNILAKELMREGCIGA
jgi:hypothetical protein